MVKKIISPNKLTLGRVILAFIFLFVIFTNFWYSNIIALGVFLLAGLTDFLDGYMARKKDDVTELGKFMDPIADKILVFSALLSFVDLGLIASWMVILILARDFLINGLRFIAAQKGKVLSANQLAKHKTFSQMFVIILILLGLILKDVFLEFFGVWDSTFQFTFELSVFFLMLLVVMLSLFSGIMYFYNNRKIFNLRKNV